MNQITCNVITDLLELYTDDIVSDDTKRLVEDHLLECAECKEKLSMIKQNLNIPAEISTEPIRKIKRKIKKKILIGSLVSVFVAAALFFGAVVFITYYKAPIPYANTHIYSVEEGDNYWEILLHFFDRIDEYAYTLRQLDDTTAECYFYFIGRPYATNFSYPNPENNQIRPNDYISIPAYEVTNISSFTGDLIEPINVQTIRIYYCIYNNGKIGSGKMDFSERYLIWEAELEQSEQESQNKQDVPTSAKPTLPSPADTDDSSPTVVEVDFQEQLANYLSGLFDEAYGPHYDGLWYSITYYEESVADGAYVSTFLWTMHHLGNGLDIPSDYGKEQEGNMYLQVTAKISVAWLDTASIVALADNSVTGPPTYQIPIADYFPPLPVVPPIDLEVIKNYVHTYMQLIIDGDTAELARFLLIDGGVQDRYIKIAERVIEYYASYDISGAEVQRVYYFDDELGRRYIAIVCDGRGEMYRIDLVYGDGLAGIDVRMFE